MLCGKTPLVIGEAAHPGHQQIADDSEALAQGGAGLAIGGLAAEPIGIHREGDQGQLRAHARTVPRGASRCSAQPSNIACCTAGRYTPAHPREGGHRAASPISWRIAGAARRAQRGRADRAAERHGGRAARCRRSTRRRSWGRGTDHLGRQLLGAQTGLVEHGHITEAPINKRKTARVRLKDRDMEVSG